MNVYGSLQETQKPYLLLASNMYGALIVVIQGKLNIKKILVPEYLSKKLSH